MNCIEKLQSKLFFHIFDVQEHIFSGTPNSPNGEFVRQNQRGQGSTFNI